MSKPCEKIRYELEKIAKGGASKEEVLKLLKKMGG